MNGIAYTPNGVPYQTLASPPHGPELGEKLAMAIDGALSRIAVLEAATQNVAAAFDVENADGTTTSTGYTAVLSGGGVACGTAFVAPASGEVLIFNTVEMLNSAANYSLCTIRVRTGNVVGSGSDVLAAGDEQDLAHNGTLSARHGNSHPLSGLTPGAEYNVQQLFRVTAGTGTFRRKSLIVLGVN